MKWVRILSVFTLLGPVAGLAQEATLVTESGPVVVDLGSTAYMVTFMPHFAGGTVILRHRAVASEPAYSVYSRDGNVVARFRIDIPEASETIGSSVAPLRDGSGYVAVAIAVNGLDRVSTLCFLDRRGTLKKVVPTSPLLPAHLTIANDGTIWGFGGAGPEDRPTSEDPVVFHYSADGKLLGTALPRKLFGSEPPYEVWRQSGPAFLVSESNRVAVYSPQMRQLFELGLDRKVIGS